MGFFSGVAERPDDLQRQAQAFVDDLTGTVQDALGGSGAFEAKYVDNRVLVNQVPAAGIPLTFQGMPLMTMKMASTCAWDLERKFLAMYDSSVRVLAQDAGNQPLFRYEYVRSPDSVPAAHLHVHAHRDALTYVMTKVGRTSKRPGRTGKQDTIPTLQDLHFPLGGHRFRPVLEDVLEMLIDEFNIDQQDNARDVLAESRAQWRLTQTAAGVAQASCNG